MTEADWRSALRLASELRRAARTEEAIAAYKRVLAIRPDLPDSWYNLALLQRQSREFDEALESYARALSLQVSKAEEVHLNRAVILSDHLHRPVEAEAELRAALEENAAYVPAHLNLGNLMEDLGRRDEAQTAYERAIQLEPENRLALARLATISSCDGLDAKLVERVQSAIADARTSWAERADLGFALAGLLDRAGRYEEAFEAARSANQASKAAAGSRGKYDRQAQEDFVDASIRTFGKPARSTSGAEAPVFILGMFRSGSTLVEQILGQHSRVRAAGELDLIPALARSIAGYPSSIGGDPEIDRWRKDYLGGLPEQPSPRMLITDKRPENFLHVGLIKTLFPDARIVNTIRNPLDNLLSLYFLHLDPDMAYALDLADAAHWHAQYERLMAHWRATYPGDILDVNYDLLVREPRPVIEQLLGFLGLDWEDGLLDFHQARTAVKTASVWQVRQPLHDRSSGRWQNYGRQLAPLVALLERDQRA